MYVEEFSLFKEFSQSAPEQFSRWRVAKVLHSMPDTRVTEILMNVHKTKRSPETDLDPFSFYFVHWSRRVRRKIRRSESENSWKQQGLTWMHVDCVVGCNTCEVVHEVAYSCGHHCHLVFIQVEVKLQYSVFTCKKHTQDKLRTLINSPCNKVSFGKLSCELFVGDESGESCSSRNGLTGPVFVRWEWLWNIWTAKWNLCVVWDVKVRKVSICIQCGL